MHTHEPAHISEGKNRNIEVCECGATRYVFRHPHRIEAWHTCKLCTHPWGLPQDVNTIGTVEVEE